MFETQERSGLKEGKLQRANSMIYNLFYPTHCERCNLNESYRLVENVGECSRQTAKAGREVASFFHYLPSTSGRFIISVFESRLFPQIQRFRFCFCFGLIDRE